MTRSEALEEVVRCARLVTDDPDTYYMRELRMALEELDRAAPDAEEEEA